MLLKHGDRVFVTVYIGTCCGTHHTQHTMSPPRFSAVHDGALTIRWLHIPKAGSAFVNVVARFGCPSLVGTNRSFSIAADFVHWLNASQTSSRARRRCPRLSPPWAAHQPVLRAESGQPARRNGVCGCGRLLAQLRALGQPAALRHVLPLVPAQPYPRVHGAPAPRPKGPARGSG